MADPILSRTHSAASPGVLKPASPAAGPRETGDDFAALLRRQLETVAQMQADADKNVEDLLSGRTQNISDVFVAARKAQVAFGLLMEVRNKMLDAYSELKQLRV